MFRVTRMVTAAALALAIAGLPVVLDRCAELCEAHTAVAASEPSCHHAAPETARIGRVPTPCGHDHAPVVAAAKDAALTVRSSHVMAAIEILPPAPISLSIAHDASSQSPPGPSRTLDRHSLALRI